MDEDPFAVLADGDRDRLHRGLTVGRAVARVDVEVTRPQAVRAMVAMGGAGRGERDVEPAMDAAERFGAAVVAALALGSGQLDSISGTQECRRVERRHAPDMERPSRSGRSRGLGDGRSYERAVLRRRDADAAATALANMGRSPFRLAGHAVGPSDCEPRGGCALKPPASRWLDGFDNPRDRDPDLRAGP